MPFCRNFACKSYILSFSVLSTDIRIVVTVWVSVWVKPILVPILIPFYCRPRGLLFLLPRVQNLRRYIQRIRLCVGLLEIELAFRCFDKTHLHLRFAESVF